MRISARALVTAWALRRALMSSRAGILRAASRRALASEVERPRGELSLDEVARLESYVTLD